MGQGWKGAEKPSSICSHFILLPITSKFYFSIWSRGCSSDQKNIYKWTPFSPFLNVLDQYIGINCFTLESCSYWAVLVDTMNVEVVKMSPTHSYHWNVTITLPPLTALLGCSLMYLSCHHNCQHILCSGYLWPTAVCQHKCFCSSQRTRSRNFYSWMKPKHFLLFLRNVFQLDRHELDTNACVGALRNADTACPSTCSTTASEKKHHTRKPALPTLSHTDSSLIRN